MRHRDYLTESLIIYGFLLLCGIGSLVILLLHCHHLDSAESIIRTIAL